MQQHTTLSRGSIKRLDHIPDYVMAAAIKGIRGALREIVHDRREQRKSTISTASTRRIRPRTTANAQMVTGSWATPRFAMQDPEEKNEKTIAARP